MRFKKWAVLLCAILLSLFTSFSLIFISVLNDESELFETYELRQKQIKTRVTGIKSFLKTPWNEEAEEKISKKFVKLYSINLRAGTSNLSPWLIANNWVSSSEIYPESIPELGTVLNAMNKREIISADLGHKGTQLKLTITLKGGQLAVFKPKWYKRDFVIKGLPYEGHDRHNGEIVSFHLNRILGFRRAPIVVGRIVDLEKEIIPVASKRLKQTFFTRNGSDLCFLGKCSYCKSREDAACAEGTRMEGAVILWLPRSLSLSQYRHPWSRTYNVHRKARWELVDSDISYCNSVRELTLFESSDHLLLDIIDTSVFDFLIGNADRHHFEVFANFTDKRLLLMDNAKSFGNPNKDERSILAPLLQCKMKTTAMLLNELKGGIISRVLKAVLSSDPVAPLLNDFHLVAVGRRLDALVKALVEEVIDFV